VSVDLSSDAQIVESANIVCKTEFLESVPDQILRSFFSNMTVKRIKRSLKTTLECPEVDIRTAYTHQERKISKISKTYSNEDSLVVTHLTTSSSARCLISVSRRGLILSPSYDRMCLMVGLN
jgi:hypothetical protein